MLRRLQESWGICDLKAVVGIVIGGTFLLPLTVAFPMLCLCNGAMERCMGSTAGPAQGQGADRGHKATTRRCQQGQATKEEFLYIAFVVEACL